jgi:hypothetical protein
MEPKVIIEHEEDLHYCRHGKQYTDLYEALADLCEWCAICAADDGYFEPEESMTAAERNAGRRW